MSRRTKPPVVDGREDHPAWLGLVDINGPFMALPVLMRAWPSLGAIDRSTREMLRVAHADGRVDPQLWIDFVLRRLLGWSDALRYLGPDTDLGMTVTEHATRVEPAFALEDPENGEPRLLGMIIKPGDHPTARPRGDAWPATPADRMAKLCRHHGVELGLITDGRWFALIWAPRNGVTTTAVFDTVTWTEAADQLAVRAFVSLLQRRRFFAVPPGDTLPALLRESVDRQEEVRDALGQQLLRAVELLVAAIGRHDVRQRERGERGLDQIADSHDIYHGAMVMAMRVVFLLFAEERGLLPSDNELFASAYSVGRLCDDLERQAQETSEEDLEHSAAAWHRLVAVSNAIHNGVSHPRLSVPAYDGPMFDPAVHPWLANVAVDDRTVLHMLRSVQYVQIKRERRRLSFRALGVEQIGYVYENLLAYDGFRAVGTMVGLVGKDGLGEVLPVAELERHYEGHRRVESLAQTLAETYANSGIGTPKALAKRLLPPSGPARAQALRTLLAATGNDRELAERLLPFVGVIRRDLRGLPVVIQADSLYLGRSSARGNTGAHYTPPDLADEVVRGALDPVLYDPGPLQTNDENAWRPRSSRDILSLRVADITVGSGAFLVAACRYLAEHLIQAWAAEGDPEARRLLAAGSPRPADAEADPLTIRARREIIQRCLYGVDVNPQAVEIAKLSLWLITMDPTQPFTFLDDRLIVGDALLGVTSIEQLEALHLDPSKGRALQDRWLGDPAKGVRKLVAEIADGRRQLSDIASDSLAAVHAKETLNNDLVAKASQLTLVADLIVGASIANAGRAEARLNEDLVGVAELARRIAAGIPGSENAARELARRWLAVDLSAGAPQRRPVHWCLVFADVFEAGGFHVIAGNQPFLGGQKLAGAHGTAYREYLVRWLGRGLRGSADLVAYVVLRTMGLLRARGQAGIIATNTLAQGDTRQVGLDQIVADGVVVRQAVKSRRWPGQSSVLEVCVVWLSLAEMPAEVKSRLDGHLVSRITPTLDPASRVSGKPERLVANRGIAFQGSNILGTGFTMSPDEADALIARDRRNAEVLFPYLNGEDLNQRPDSSARRWVINFHDWPQERAATYLECFNQAIASVKPERARNKRPARRDRWWQFAERAPELYRAVERLDRVIAITLVSKVVMPAMVPTGQVFAHKLAIFATDDPATLALLSSAPHYWWAIKRSSTMKADLNYSPTDVFETLARPNLTEELRLLGERLDTYRRGLALARRAGLTATYNLVHDSTCTDTDIVELRTVHKAIDEAAVRAYGWDDLLARGLDHGFHDTRQGVRYTVGPFVRQEILDRLLELNLERRRKEVAAARHHQHQLSLPTAGETSLQETSTA